MKKISILALIILCLGAWWLWEWNTRIEVPPPELIWNPDQERYTTHDPDGGGPLKAGPVRVADTVVVDLQDDLSPEELRSFREAHQLAAFYHSVHSVKNGLVVASVPEAEIGIVLSELAHDPKVEAASPNYVYSISQGEEGGKVDFPNDPQYKFQWHMEQINSESAWRWTSGEGVVVAVIDTGVAYEDSDDGTFHQVEDLAETRFVEGYDFINRREKAYDDNAHGTHVAGTVAQSTNNGVGVTGVAFGSTVMPVKVLSGRGSGTLASVADGICFAADNGAKVMNLSLGSPSKSPVMDEAVSYAVERGVLVVCSAGNSSRPKPGYPAGCEGAISVSALDYHEKLTYYSNFGPHIDIAAPGGDTRHDHNGDGMPDGVYQNTIGRMNPKESGYFNYQGTSMSSPHAAGVFVLGASLGVTRAEALEDLIYDTARPAPEGAKEGYGAGILDAGAVARKAGFEYGRNRLLLGLVVFTVPLALYLRRRRIVAVAPAVPSLLLGSCGLLWWVPALNLNTAPLDPLLVNGFCNWDLFLLGVAHHGSLLTHSVLIPALLGLAATRLRVLRPLVAGFSAGVAGSLAFTALSRTTQMSWLPEDLQVMWLWANALACICLAVAAALRD